MWNLIVHIPDSFPKPYELRDGKTSIGRAMINDIVVEDAAAPRYHAEILVDEAGKRFRSRTWIAPIAHSSIMNAFLANVH
jgi:pSer/pThr/pTyr-binding forkhead associated (FHA) protein